MILEESLHKEFPFPVLIPSKSKGFSKGRDPCNLGLAGLRACGFGVYGFRAFGDLGLPRT